MTDPIELLSDVQRLRLQPGDILVLRSEHDLTAEQAGAIKRQVIELLGGRHQVMVLSGLSLELLEPDTPKTEKET